MKSGTSPDAHAQKPAEGQLSSESNLSTKIDTAAELKAFNQVVSAIQELENEARNRVLGSVVTFLGLSKSSFQTAVSPSGLSSISSSPTASSFSEDRTLSAKQFLYEKKPVTDIERIACLAYYLTHYRSMPHFKTLDLSTLNTEAAQIKFSNAATAVENATLAGLLVAAGGGKKQISAVGELYVEKLPDRDAAKDAIAHVRPRRKSKRHESSEGN